MEARQATLFGLLGERVTNHERLRRVDPGIGE